MTATGSTEERTTHLRDYWRVIWLGKWIILAVSLVVITLVTVATFLQTPVFRATPGQASRMHVLNGASADRDGTFILHGHLWQRDPFVCPGESDLGLVGRCNPSTDTVDSTALGMNPQGKWMGGEEGMGHVYGHWPILFNAGGANAAALAGCSANGACDFLFSDYAPNGNRNGQFGILRVQQ